VYRRNGLGSKPEKVGYLDCVDITRLWFLNEPTASVIKEKFEMSTEPYLNDLDAAFLELEAKQARPDFRYGDFSTGKMWLLVLKRTEDIWRPNLSTECPSMLPHCLYLSI
jgi:hypothetical protein